MNGRLVIVLVISVLCCGGLLLSLLLSRGKMSGRPTEPQAAVLVDGGQRLAQHRIDGLALRTYHEYMRRRRGDNDKQLMFDCEYATCTSRGLGDRLKGMSTAFYLALVLDRKFVARFDGHELAPVRPIVDELESDPDDFALFDDSPLVSLWDDAFDDAAAAAQEILGALSDHQAVQRLRLSCNGEIGHALLRSRNHSYHFLTPLSPGELFRVFARLHLRRPGPRIAAHLHILDAHYPALSAPVVHVGVQLRVTEGRQDKHEAVRCLLAEVVQLCSQTRCAVFVTGDEALQTLLMVRRLRAALGADAAFTSMLPPKHIGQVDHADEGLSTWFDWYMLSQQDVLFVSQSGYSLTAIMANPNVVLAQSRNIFNRCLQPHCDVRPASACTFNNCLTRPTDPSTGWNRC